MTHHTILLSVDGSLLVELDSREREYAAYRTGSVHVPLDVPSDARELEVPAPDGRGPFFYRPAVVRTLRDLARGGVDIVWNSRWLASPLLLEGLSRALELDSTVREPRADELPAPPVDARIDHGPNVFWEHWKVQALVHRVRDLPEDADLVIIDAQLDFSSRRLADGVARRARRDVARVGGIATFEQRGLDEQAAAALAAWASGGDLPRI